MEVETIINELSALTGPNRRIDTMLKNFVTSLEAGRHLTAVQNIPHFTEGLDVAYNLAEMIYPNGFGGVSWDERGGRAQIGDMPICEGANPAIALCIAALRAYQAR